MKGKYSEISNDYKMQVKKYWIELYGKIPGFVNSTIKRFDDIFNKSDKLREKMEIDLCVKLKKGCELGQTLDISNETYEFKNEKKIKLENIHNIF